MELQTYHRYVLIWNKFVLGMYLVRTGTYWYKHGKTKKQSGITLGFEP
jgi:hypothetical protein